LGAEQNRYNKAPVGQFGNCRREKADVFYETCCQETAFPADKCAILQIFMANQRKNADSGFQMICNDYIIKLFQVGEL